MSKTKQELEKEHKQINTDLATKRKELKHLQDLREKGERRYNGGGINSPISTLVYQIEMLVKKRESIKVEKEALKSK